MTIVENKTIQIISSYFYPVIAGSETYFLKVYGYLINKGWRINVITTKDTPIQRNQLVDQEEINGITIKRNNYFSFASLPFSLGIKYRSTGVVCFNDFSTFPDLFVCFYSMILKLFGLKKYTLVLHSMGLFNYNSEIYPHFSFRLKQLIDHSLGVWLINNSVDSIHSVSQDDKNGLITAGVRASLIEIIGCGIEEEAFSKDINQLASVEIKNKIANKKYILQVARVNRIKNFETSIKALSFLPQDISFFVAGPIHDQKYLEELTKLINELGLNDRVVFLREVSVSDKYYLMKNSLLLVHMSKYEGFGIVVLEAMSQGCLCVVSKNGAMHELIKDGINGYCEDYNDFKAVADRLNFVLEHPQLADKIRMNNRNFSLDKSWKNISEKIELFYNKAKL
ncbi:MAG TPA: glycosyltransferase family 4 protein [Patescibacteria group bacterium]